MVHQLDPIGRFARIDWVASTGSTNADAVSAARAHPDDAIVVFADEQTAGRGRRDRTWAMPRGGGLLVSFYVPRTAPGGQFAVPMALGVAAVEAIALTGRSVALKWPNDLVTGDGKKLAGMLSELVGPADDDGGIVVGFGCNVSWPEAPLDELPDATSLDRIGDAPVDRLDLARTLVAGFDAELDRLDRFGAPVIIDRYRRRCATLGAEIRVEIAGAGILTGRAVDVDASGRLVVEAGSGRRAIDVGDVIHLRRSGGGDE